MKKQNIWIWVGLGLAAWWIWKQTKKPGSASPMQKVTDGLSNLFTPAGPAAKEAASDARSIVADVLDKTTFAPDLTTDRDRYIEDQKSCK